MMGPQLVDIRRGPNDDRYTWTPFAPSDQFTPDWWDRVPYMVTSLAAAVTKLIVFGTEPIVRRVESDSAWSGLRWSGLRAISR